MNDIILFTSRCKIVKLYMYVLNLSKLILTLARAQAGARRGAEMYALGFGVGAAWRNISTLRVLTTQRLIVGFSPKIKIKNQLGRRRSSWQLAVDPFRCCTDPHTGAFWVRCEFVLSRTNNCIDAWPRPDVLANRVRVALRKFYSFLLCFGEITSFVFCSVHWFIHCPQSAL